MNRAKFYAYLRQRNSGVFGTSLSQRQVEGMEALLDAGVRGRLSDLHHMANVLGQVYHETGGRMYPVREAFASTDKGAMAALEKAWKAGRMKWVKTPYWREGWFGRGFIQITHKANYAKLGAAIGMNLASRPDLALVPRISADIAVVGMRDGLFTGKRLSHYDFPDALGYGPDGNPRRIVNGRDGTDKKVAGYHRAFYNALIAGGWGTYTLKDPVARPQAPKPEPVAPKSQPEAPQKPTAKGGLVAAVFAGLAALAAWAKSRGWW